MHEYLLTFLRKLELRSTPAPGGFSFGRDPSNKPRFHHAITYAEYGSWETDFRPQLALHVFTSEGMQTLFLDKDDLEKPVDELVEDVIKAISPDTQAKSQEAKG
jgi:hypothetical protein